MAVKAGGWGRRERLRVALNVGAMTAIAAALLVLANVLAHSLHAPWLRGDWTAKRLHTLDPRTAALLDDLRDEATLALFAAPPGTRTPRDQAFSEVVDRTWALLREAGSRSPRVRIDRVDHYRDVDRAAEYRRRYDLEPTPLAFLLVASGERHRTVFLKDLAEIDQGRVVRFEGERHLHSALHEVTRGTAPAVTFVQGHRERGPAGGDSGPPAALWTVAAREGYRPRALDLPAAAEIPPDAGLLVLLLPLNDLTERETALLRAHLRGGGRVLLVLPALVPFPRLSALLGEWRLDVSDGVQVVHDPERRGPLDRFSILVRGHEISSRHPIVAPLSVPGPLLFFAGCRPLSSGLPDDEVSVHWLLATGAKTALERIDEKGPPRPDKPRALALAVEGRPPGAARAARIVVLSGSGCVDDRVLLEDGYQNRRLLVNALDWLAGREPYLVVPPSTLESRRLPMTAAERRVVFWTVLVALPLLPLVLGAGILLLRRR